LLPKDIDPYAEGFDELIEELNSELIIVGLVGLIDPLKPDIPDTVRCKKKAYRYLCCPRWRLDSSGYVVVPESASSL